MDAELAEMGVGEAVVEVAEMGDAEILHLEDEDRVAVRLKAAATVHAGGNVAHTQIVHLDFVLGHAVARTPALENVLDARVGQAGEMAVVGVVHRCHVGRLAGGNVAVIVGDGACAFGCLDEEARMAEIGERYRLALGDRCQLHGCQLHARIPLGEWKAATGGGGRRREQAHAEKGEQ